MRLRMSSVRISKFLLKEGCGDIWNWTESSPSCERGVSMNTRLKRASPSKKGSRAYMSEESSHTQVSFGKMSDRACPADSGEPLSTSETISTASTSSLDSCVLQSKEWIFSISLPQNEMR